MQNQDEIFMREAIKLAQHAASQNEVPVGAVAIYQNEIVGRGWNCPISTNDPTAHAEIIALRAAATKIQNYRLVDVTLYVTLEPCVMCVGAMLHARIKKVVFGAYDPKAGAIASVMKLLDENKFNHTLSYQGGILATECGKMLQEFFQARRKSK